jgi:anion-transporting  ArsA/GET3 family ATPase
MTPLDQRRFLFVTGKGGVGKTTVSAALAVAMAKRGKRVLVTACDAKERLSTLFDAEPLTPEISRVAEGIWAVKLDAQVALREYGGMILKSEALFGAVFDNKYVRSFFAGVPGLHEWAMLGKAWYHATEELPDGRQRFDVVLFDAPATGHGLDMLRVPKVIVDVVPPGVLRRDAERAWKMFQDERHAGVVVVTVPEDMPASETLELVEVLERELMLPVASLVINAVITEMFSEGERKILLADRDLDRGSPGDEAIACGIRRSIRERVQVESMARLDAIRAPRVVLPLIRTDPDTAGAIARLAEHFSSVEITESWP